MLATETTNDEEVIYCIILKDKEIFYPLLQEKTAKVIIKAIKKGGRWLELETKKGIKLLSTDQIASIIPYDK